jgi:hypothetical protein
MIEVSLKEALETMLAHFTGTMNYHRSSFFTKSIFHTDGVQYLSDKAGAFWLIDAIVSYQMKPSIARHPFQVWSLKVENRSAVLTCGDGNDTPPLVTQKIPYTDFPLDKISLYLENGSLDGEHIHKILMLPSER